LATIVWQPAIGGVISTGEHFAASGSYWRQCLRKEILMISTALFVRLEAKPGKEDEVAGFLKDALSLVQQETATVAWFGIRLGPSTFGIFDAFPDEAGRQAHLNGRVAAALMAKAGDLFSQPPSIEKADVLASKLPDRGVEKAA
jgi:quinol monooxygenase YgiN